MSKRDDIADVLRYHGYKVSEACIDALVAVSDDDESDTGDFYDSWGYRRNRSSWE